MGERIECVATCRPGLEGVLAEELRANGARGIRNAKRAVNFTTHTAGLYRLNMAVRSAIQILIPIRTFNARDYDLLYFQSRKINWHQYFTADKTLRIDVNGRSAVMRNTQYVVHRVKDSIVDTFRKLSGGNRPSIDKDIPDVHIVVHLDGERVTVCLDSSGVPLFKRGYRLEHGGAPVKEDLAAGILLLSEIEKCAGLVDPMCGSGTFLFEGWMILNRVAPNLDREFAFQHWLDYQPELHERERKRLEDEEKIDPSKPVIGCDIDRETFEIADRIREKYFSDTTIEVHHGPFQDFETEVPEGLLVSNPPYGERMGDVEALKPLYIDLGYAAKRMVPGGKMAVFTCNRKAARQIRLKADKACTLFNGSLEGLLYQYTVKRWEPREVESSE